MTPEERLRALEQRAESRARGWWQAATITQRIILAGLLLFILVVLVWWGYSALTDWSDARRLQHLSADVERLEQEKTKLVTEAAEAKAKLTAKEAEVNQLTQRAEAAEANLQAAIAATTRARSNYTRVLSAPVDHTRPPPSDDATCQRLARLGVPCQ